MKKVIKAGMILEQLRSVNNKKNKNVKIINPSKDIIITEEEGKILIEIIDQYLYLAGFCNCDLCKNIKNFLNKLEGEKGVGRKTKRVKSKK